MITARINGTIGAHNVDLEISVDMLELMNQVPALIEHFATQLPNMEAAINKLDKAISDSDRARHEKQDDEPVEIVLN